MSIQPQYIPLTQLLSNKLFRIPPYQRAYSWQTKHRKDLFRDIKALQVKGGDSEHFMATVVGLRRDTVMIGTDNYQIIDVVDGQQRVTTLVLILKAIFRHLDREAKGQRKAVEELAELLIKEDETSMLLLQTNHDLSTYFASYIRENIVPSTEAVDSLADKALAEGIRDCERFVLEWREENDLLTLLSIIKNRLRFIFHEVTDESTVYSVFEVLNSRGLEVSWFDRTKTALMGAAFEDAKNSNKDELIKELHQLWGKIYQTVGLRQGLSSEALKFAATLKKTSKVNKILSEEASLAKLVSLAGGTGKGVIDVSNWLLKVVKVVDQLMAEQRKAAVTGVSHARFVAVAIRLQFPKKVTADRLLDQWERVTFRIFGICDKDARTKVGQYVRLGCEIYRERLSEADSMARLKALGSGDFAIGTAVKNLMDCNCYEDWQEELRYFLMRYEEHLAQKSGQKFKNEQWEKIWTVSASKSIEHIHPQKPEKNGPWKGALGRGPNLLARHVNRLGNLVVLPPGLNSKLGNKGFDTKKRQYKKTGLLAAGEVASKREWTKERIIEREKKLIEFAKAAWDDVK